MVFNWNYMSLLPVNHSYLIAFQFAFGEGERILIRSVCKSHVSPMPFDFRIWMGHLGVDDKCLDIMLPSVGGMVTRPCSSEYIDRFTRFLKRFSSASLLSTADQWTSLWRTELWHIFAWPLNRFDKVNAGLLSCATMVTTNTSVLKRGRTHCTDLRSLLVYVLAHSEIKAVRPQGLLGCAVW